MEIDDVKKVMQKFSGNDVNKFTSEVLTNQNSDENVSAENFRGLNKKKTDYDTIPYDLKNNEDNDDTDTVMVDNMYYNHL